MAQVQALNVAIVGGGPGCKAIMKMIFAEKLSHLQMNLVGVACTNPNAVGYRYAQEKGIYTTTDYRSLYKLKELDMIIELTRRDDLANDIFRTKPDHVLLMDHVAARLFWDVFQIQEARIVDREQAAEAQRDSMDRLQVAYDQSIIYAKQLSEEIAERKHAEEVLRQSEAEKKAILDASVDSIRLVDKEMRIRWANKTTTTNLDIDPGDILGETCHKILANREIPCEGCPSKKAIETGWIEQSVLCVPNAAGGEGETYWDCYGVPLKDQSGKTVDLIQIARDVTGQIEAQKELKRRHDALNAIHGILFRVTKEYNLNGMGNVLQDIVKEFYPNVETLVYLLTPQRDGFYFPRPERGHIRESCYDQARKRIRSSKLEHDLLKLLTGGKIRPTCFGGKAECSVTILDLAAGFNSWMTVPIEVEDVCYGLFMVGSSSADVWVEDDVVFVESLIRQISGVIRYQTSKEVREEAFRNQLAGPDKFMGIVGSSQAMQETYELVKTVADSESTVLITGESGAGKELVARAIHQAGKYKGTPFIAAHCSSFVPTLVQAELFGHEKGAFTGATSRKLGRLERAHGGILFLDEVAELPLDTQVLLLRFLQDRSFERVGGEHRIEVNVRIIAATNKQIEGEVEAGRLREDFYYRLNVIPVRVPPLRERSIDVALLADHFLKTYCLIERKEITGFDTEAMQLMMDYDWPGNVRELQNTVARCVVLSSSPSIGAEELPEKIRTRPATHTGYSLAEHERNLVENAMRECKWNKQEAARLLQISRGTLYSKLRRFNIQPKGEAT